LGFHYLDSGALYRLVAMAAQRHGVALDNVEALAVLAAHMDVAFEMDAEGGSPKVVLETENVSDLIRSEEVGAQASRVAALPEVRNALLQRQKAFAQQPGLVADGRDMGTIIFPDAEVKIFLTASAGARAERRHKQLITKGESGNLRDLVEKVESRDKRDRTRAVAPLLPAEDAVTVDSTALNIAEALEAVLTVVAQRLKI
jgi:cytidylate kinase